MSPSIEFILVVGFFVVDMGFYWVLPRLSMRLGGNRFKRVFFEG